MEQSKRDKILERLRKLQALADRPGSEAEAEAAMARIQALLEEYSLTPEDMQASGAPKEGKRVLRRVDIRRNYHFYLMRAAAALYGTFAFNYKGRQPADPKAYGVMGVAGREEFVDLTINFAKYLDETVLKLARFEYDRIKPAEKFPAFRRSFRFHCAVRVYTRATEIAAYDKQAAADSARNNRALVVVSEHKQTIEFLRRDFNMDFKRGPGVHSKARSETGAVAGRAAGDNVGLGRQLGGTGRPLMIGAR